MGCGVGMNNPIYALIDEASRTWTNAIDQLKIGSVINIGTGLAPISRIRGENPYVAKTLSDIAMDAKSTTEAFAFNLDHNGPKFPNMRCFRFNVSGGFSQTPLADGKKKHRRISRVTNTYMDQIAEMLESSLKSILGHLTKGIENESDSSFEYECNSSIPLVSYKNSLIFDLPISSMNHQQVNLLR